MFQTKSSVLKIIETTPKEQFNMERNQSKWNHLEKFLHFKIVFPADLYNNLPFPSLKWTRHSSSFSATWKPTPVSEWYIISFRIWISFRSIFHSIKVQNSPNCIKTTPSKLSFMARWGGKYLRNVNTSIEQELSCKSNFLSDSITLERSL